MENRKPNKAFWLPRLVSTCDCFDTGRELTGDNETVTSWRVTFASVMAEANSWSGKLVSNFGKLNVARFYGEATWILTGQIAAAVGGIVGVPLLAHYLRPEDYGRLALGGTVAALVQQICLGPLGAAGQRFYAASVESNELADFLRAAGRVVFITCAFIAVIGGLTVVALAGSPFHSSVLLAGWSLVFAILTGVSSVFDGIQTAARQRAIVAWHQGLGVWLRFGFAACLVRLFGGPALAMAGFAAGITVILISQVVFFRRAILSSPAYRPGLSPERERDLRRQMWVYARPLSSWGLFTWGQIASDRWALESLTTTRAVGIYQVLYQLGYYPISMASAFVNQLIQPILFARAGTGTDENRVANAHRIIHMLLAASLFLSLAGFVVSAVMCKFLFRLLLPPAYGPAAHLMPLMVLSAGIFECGQIVSLKHMLSPNPRSLIAPKIATAVLGACLNFAGAYLFGLTGVVAASLCFSVVFCVWVVVVAPKVGAAYGKTAVPPAAAIDI